MYINIFKIILGRKFDLKFNFIKKVLSKINIHISKRKTLIMINLIFGCFTSAVLAVGASYILSEKYYNTVLSVMMIYMIIAKFFDGAFEYKSTFIFPFDAMKKMTIAKDKKLYLTLLAVNLIYSLVFSESIFFAIVLVGLMFGLSMTSLIIIINILLVNVVLFVLGNIIMGKYMYSVITRKVGIYRLGVYAVALFFFARIIFIISNAVINFFKLNFIGKIHSAEDLLNDNLIKGIFDNIGVNITSSLKIYSFSLDKFSKIIHMPVFSVVLIVLGAVIFISKVNLIPKDMKEIIYCRKDFYSVYNKILIWMGDKLTKNDILLRYQIRSFASYKWLFSKEFFQIVFINYEAISYMGFFTSAILLCNNSVIRLQLLLCMVIMSLANQSFDLRVNGYAYFSMSREKGKLFFLKTSLMDKNRLYRVKELSFYLCTIIPTIVVLAYAVLLAIILNFPLQNFLILLIIAIGCYVIMPKIQMHMLPLVTNFDYIDEYQIGESFEEDELADKIQEFPRIFLVVIPMIVTATVIIFDSCRVMLTIFIEVFLFIILAFVLRLYMNKIRDRGMKRVYDKIK